MSNKQAKKLSSLQMKAIGMEGEGWTIQDKLAIYRGLVKIYNREEANQTKDSGVVKKRNYRKISSLRKEVEELRRAVKLSSLGEATRIRNVLHDDQEILLALQNSEPRQISEVMERKINMKKIHLSQVSEKRKKFEQELINKRMSFDEKETLINSTNFEIRDQEQTLKNQIQEFSAKYLAAKNIEGVYRKILSLLYKDHRWHEAVLESLLQDGNLQQKSLMRATELGQLATEEVVNMRMEYSLREADVRRHMQLRIESLRDMQEQLANLIEETTTLVKAESAVSLGLETSSLYSVEGNQTLENEVREIDDLLKRLQEATLVPDFCDIYPRMQELLVQNDRLLEELYHNDKSFHDLLNKRNHGHLLFHSLVTLTHGEKASYFAKEKKLSIKLEEIKLQIEQIENSQNEIGHLIMKICKGLHRLWQIILKVMIPPKAQRSEVSGRVDKDPKVSIVFEALHYLYLLDARMKFLQTVMPPQINPTEREKAFSYCLRMMTKQWGTSTSKKDDKVTFELVIETEDPKVPSRQAIKAKSKEIYDLATRNPYEVEQPSLKRGKK